MNTPRHLLPALIAASLLAACQPSGESQSAAEETVVVEETAGAEPEAAEPAAEAETAPAASSFDINSVPVSTVALGEFPYITLPAGYTNENHRSQTSTKDFARFPFWVNGQAHWVEGKFFDQLFGSERGKGFSPYEIQRNFDAMIDRMGGRKISEGRIPKEESEGWGREITYGFSGGLNGRFDHPAQTYLVRRADGNIWVQLIIGTGSAGLVVGKEEAFVPSAQLLPASEIKQQLDASGKATLHVNFATDKTDILPESHPQIDQVAELLKIDSALKLAVNGHTDNTGDAAHNQRLSEGRAQSVMAALTGKGIDAARLSAAGHGDSQPVADNGTEQGRAQNRRVELVKR